MSSSYRIFKNLTLVFLFFFFVYLRFYKSVDWFSFNFDEEYQAFLAWSQVLDFHPIWIGVSAGDLGFYLGPGFTYLNALLFWISKGDLSILANFSSFIGILTTISLYYVSKQVFSSKVALISSIVYGFSALLITYDHRFWNPTLIPLITVWLFFSLQKAIKDTRWFILTAFLMATSLHVHLSLLSFWIIVFYRVLRQFKTISVKTWFVSIFTYIVVISPLIVFDIVHNFDNILTPFRYLVSLSGDKSTSWLSTFLAHVSQLWLSLGRFLVLDFHSSIQAEHGFQVNRSQSHPHFIFSLISVLVLVWYSRKCVKEKHISILLVMLVSVLGLFVFYPSGVLEYYLLSFFTLAAVMFGLLLEKMPSAITFSLLSLFILYNSLSIFTMDQSKYGLTAKKNLVQQTLQEIGDEPFALQVGDDTPESYRSNAGWHYLFNSFGRSPVSSRADDSFGWIYQGTKTKNKPYFKVVIERNNTDEYIAEVVRID